MTTDNGPRSVPRTAEAAAWAGNLRTHFVLPHKQLVQTVVWSPTGDRIASLSGWGNDIALWEIAQQRQIFHVAKKSAIGNSLAFTEDGKFLFVQSMKAGIDDRHTSISILNAGTGQIVDTLEGQISTKNNAARIFALSRNGRHLALVSSGDLHGVQIYDLKSWTLERVLKPSSQAIEQIAFGPDSETLAIGEYGGTVAICAATSGHCRLTGKLQPTGISALAFSPDGRTLLVGMIDAYAGATPAEMAVPRRMKEANRHKLKAFSLLRDTVTAEIDADVESVRSVSFHPDGRLFAVGGGQAVWLFDAASFKLVRKLDGFSHVSSIAFSPDGSLIAIGSEGAVTAVGPSF